MRDPQTDSTPSHLPLGTVAYPEYREGVLQNGWRVPETWEMRRADWILTEQRRTVDPSSLDTDEVYHYSIPTLQETGEGALEPPQDIGSTKLLIDGPTLLVSRLNPHKGVVTLADHKGVPTLASSEFVALRASDCVLKFAYYLYSSESSRQRLVAEVQSATRSHMRARPADITKMWHPTPPKPTQAAIAAFLDEATRKIDNLIAKKERLIELLEEKRTALITQAVTKGLDPDVPMKDSREEWLGEIPKHWDVALLDKLIDPSRPITYGIVQPGDEDPDGILMVRGQNYSNGWESTEKIFRVAPEVEAPYGRARLSEGDVVMTIVGAGTGNVAVVPRWLEGANITQTTARLAFNPRACSHRFFFFLLQSSIGHANVDLAVKGAAQPGLNLNHIAKFRVVCPPRREQQRIADFLDGQTTTIDSLIERVRSAQELLAEYRSALITAAVTGKIDVRDHAA